MKTTLFLSALAAFPSFISAFSTYDSDLYIRDAAPSAYEESYELAMRSLEARFTETAPQIAHALARRMVEDEDLVGEHLLAIRGYKDDEKLHAAAKKNYKAVNANPSSSHSDKSAAASTARGHAQDVVNGRTAAAARYGDNDPGHQTAISNWGNAVSKWDKTIARHDAAHAKSQKTRRSIDDIELLDFFLTS